MITRAVLALGLALGLLAAMAAPAGAQEWDACRVESFGFFDSGDSWSGSAESTDFDPATNAGEGDWIHQLDDGRSFRGRVTFVRCRANGGVIATLLDEGESIYLVGGIVEEDGEVVLTPIPTE